MARAHTSAKHAPAQMTREHNVTMAVSKVATAPLQTLTDAMIESIANSHASLRDRPRLLSQLRAQVTARREREASHG